MFVFVIDGFPCFAEESVCLTNVCSVSVRGSVVVFFDSVFVDNTAARDAGYSDQAHNTAMAYDGAGGTAVYVDSSVLTVASSVMANNNAAYPSDSSHQTYGGSGWNGGAIRVDGASTLRISDSLIYRNTVPVPRGQNHIQCFGDNIFISFER